MNKTIYSKIKEKGMMWLFARIKQELLVPTFPIYIKINKLLLWPWLKIKRLNHQSVDNELLYGIYDFEINDITYNFAVFLMDLEYEANKRNKEGFVVVFVPAKPINPLLSYEEYDSKIDIESKKWRLNNLLLPILALTMKCKGYYFLPTRLHVAEIIKKHNTYPDEYDINIIRKANLNNLIYKKLNKEGLINGLESPRQGIKYIEEWKYNKKITNLIVTITIRDCSFDPARNSKLEEWLKFANYLKNKNYHPVFIPDTDNAFEDEIKFGIFQTFNECAWNIGLRMALYESAYLNFFSPNGCAVLAMFNPKCAYIAMNMLSEGSTVTTKEVYKLVGHKIGESYKFSTSKQRLCFKEDSFQNIKEEFESYEDIKLK